MGMVIDIREFDYPAPSKEEILQKTSEISGLEVIIINSFDYEDEDLNIKVAFKGFEHDDLNITIYKLGTYNNSLDELPESFPPEEQLHHALFSTDETQTIQLVRLQTYVGREPTLINAVDFALEKLGGRDLHTSDKDRTSQFPISVEELQKRYIKQEKQNKIDDLIIKIVFLVVLTLVLLGFYFFGVAIIYLLKLFF